MLVPESEKAVYQFRLPFFAVQLAVAALVGCVIVSLAFFGSYMSMLDDRMELNQLRQVNRWQRDRLVDLEAQQVSVFEVLAQVEELDAQIREMVNMAAEQAAHSGFDYRLGLGGGEQDAVWGTAAAGAPVDPAVADLARLQVTAEMLTGSLTSQENSLREVRNAVSLEQSALASRPTIWPVASGIITSLYGYRRAPFQAGYEFHRGIDVATPRGTPVLVTADGVVTFVGWLSNYGITVSVEHEAGIDTLYAHLGKSTVEVGDRVSKGDIIGLVGTTGRSTGPHVHYEVHVDGETVNPRGYMLTRGP